MAKPAVEHADLWNRLLLLVKAASVEDSDLHVQLSAVNLSADDSNAAWLNICQTNGLVTRIKTLRSTFATFYRDFVLDEAKYREAHRGASRALLDAYQS